MKSFLRWRALAAAVALVVAAGCGGSLPGTDLPPARYVMPALEFPGLRDYRGLLNCKFRNSGLDQARLGELAHNQQIDFICLGDEATRGTGDYGISGFTEQVLFIAGGSFPVGNTGAAIVGINLREPIDAGRSTADLIGQIHSQGALALAANPSRFAAPADYALADAIEIYNQRSAWDAQSGSSMYLRSIFFTSDRLFARLDTRPDANLGLYDRMASGSQVTLAAGIGAPEQMPVMGTRVGTFEQWMQVYTTHVLARERQIDPIVDALKHGHSYVTFDFLKYVPSFAFFAESGGRKVMMGDEAAMAPGLKIKLEMPSPADKVVIYRNGDPVASADNVSNFEWAPQSQGEYRAEAYLRGCPWIYSNPVYLR